mmetsp:Transcript_69110/g.77302  ORF Transcript_69110/g.77302 Transcript_69110/m.77302 type:complete len:451 (+) Transcript_69110:33-1385(+)
MKFSLASLFVSIGLSSELSLLVRAADCGDPEAGDAGKTIFELLCEGQPTGPNDRHLQPDVPPDFFLCMKLEEDGGELFDVRDILNNPDGSMTFWSPTNEAFFNIFENPFNEDELPNILKYSISNTVYSEPPCGDDDIVTLAANNQTSATICEINEGALDAAFQEGDGNTATNLPQYAQTEPIVACNGVFYRVDNFIFPVNLNPNGCGQPDASPSLLEYMCGEQNQEQFSTACELFILAGFAPPPGDESPSLLGNLVNTLWAPTNDAFDRLPPGDLAFLRSEEGFDDLSSILYNHLVSGDYNEDLTINITSLVDRSDLKCGKTFKIGAGFSFDDPDSDEFKTITIDTVTECESIGGPFLQVGGGNRESGNLPQYLDEGQPREACNGRLYTINNVILDGTPTESPTTSPPTKTPTKTPTTPPAPTTNAPTTKSMKTSKSHKKRNRKDQGDKE